MTKAIATIKGTALVPGVSRNKRLYSHEVIGKAVTRARARLAEANGMPLTMRISHPTDEPRAPVTEIVGRVTDIWQEADGRARFTAEIADTKHGNDVFMLVDNRDGKPALKNVSIRGGWLGRTRQVVLSGGDLVESGDDLEIDGIDYTHKPGVPGAEIEHVTDPGGEPRESGPDGRTPITESVQEATLVTAITEADAPADTNKPARDVHYADPGYQKDAGKRWPLDSKAQAKAAWAAITESATARAYTSQQLKRIRQRTVKALRGHGVEVLKEGWLLDAAGKVSESAAVVEHGGQYEEPASFCININNGMVSISVSSWRIDAHDLDLVARAAMEGACLALASIDPDADGDIDLAGTAGESGESAPTAVTTESTEDPVTEPPTAEPAVPAAPEPVAPTAPEPAADPTHKEEAPAMSEPTTTPAVAASPAGDLSDASIDKLADKIGGALAAAFAKFAPAPVAAPAESAPAAPAAVVEAAPVPAVVAAPAPVAAVAPATTAVVETEDQRIARIVEAQVKSRLTEAVQRAVVQNGPPTRKGLVGRVTESGELDTGGSSGELNSHGVPSDWPDKPLHEYTADERAKHFSPALFAHVVGH